ncbi:ran-binding protein 3-like [Limulus polyphemus]|uniref:Ran-binding protein 3-like n=1 Tax=Limulus polyphemus TaxID=6850 RepID=A0ABM1BKQ9_LIMPO|nr:ran-binding protein 3-like [Limulus polyphemus]
MSEEGSSATSTPTHSSPFSAKFSTCSPTKSSADSTDSQDMFQMVSSRFILRPSPLAAQAEKLKTNGSTTSESQSLTFTSHKQEDKENKIVLDNTEQLEESDTLHLSSNSSNGAKKQVTSSISRSSETFRSSDDSPFKSLFKSECSKSSGPSEPIVTSGPTNFVFGQNLHERVVTYEDPGSDSSSSISNQLNFQAFQKSSSEDERQECTGKTAKSLTESAEEYQARQVKRKYEEVTVVTGEEGESNVLQINCKLFAFEKNSSWVEKGRGMLRLNDREVDGTLQSRLVMRTQGSLRLVLNTKVWAGMSLEQASHKTIRLSAVETDGVKVYLIMANPKDAEQLFSALECRVATLKSLDDNWSVSNLATQASVGSYDDDDTTTSDCESEVKRPRHMEGTQSGEADSTTGVAPQLRLQHTPPPEIGIDSSSNASL